MKNKSSFVSSTFLSFWLLFLFFGINGFGLVQASDVFNFKNFAWIGNNLQDENQETGDPVIGMVSFSGKDYQVVMEGDENIKNLKGYAWLGIGNSDDKYKDFSSQSDLPTLGWIGFDQGVPSEDCFGAGDCYAAKWSKKSGAVGTEGYISGWAKMLIGPEEEGNPYPESWIHFKSPPNVNSYICENNNYFVCSNAQGELKGFAWSSGALASTVGDNPGFGWINFSEIMAVPSSCEEDGVCNLNCPYDPDCCIDTDYYNSHAECKDTCATANGVCNLNCPYDPDCCTDTDYYNSHAECKGVASGGTCNVTRTTSGSQFDSGSQIEFTANIDGENTPSYWRWSCEGNDNFDPAQDFATKDSKKTCTYVNETQTTKSFEPVVKFWYNDSQGELKSDNCINSVGAGVKIKGVSPAGPGEPAGPVGGACDCKVQLRVKNETSDGTNVNYTDYLTNVHVGDVILGKIDENGSCGLDKNIPAWFVEDSSLGNGKVIAFEVDKNLKGTKRVNANIGSNKCKEANFDVVETLRWR